MRGDGGGRWEEEVQRITVGKRGCAGEGIRDTVSSSFSAPPPSPEGASRRVASVVASSYSKGRARGRILCGVVVVVVRGADACIASVVVPIIPRRVGAVCAAGPCVMRPAAASRQHLQLPWHPKRQFLWHHDEVPTISTGRSR
eukprot:623325-Rhodomonas_salina.2